MSKSCPVCGDVLRQADMSEPECGILCAACNALSAQEMNEQYPIMACSLPDFRMCLTTCLQASNQYKGPFLTVGGGWEVWQGQVELEASHYECPEVHYLDKDPKVAAIKLWKLTRNHHGLDHCYVCYDWRQGCKAVLIDSWTPGEGVERKRVYVCPDCAHKWSEPVAEMPESML